MVKYVEFSFTPEKNLKVTLLPSRREDIIEMYAQETWASDDRLREVLNYQLENGWEWVTQYAGLTDAPVISDEVEFDAHQEVTHIGRMYWYMDYEVTDPVRELLRDGAIVFHGAA